MHTETLTTDAGTTLGFLAYDDKVGKRPGVLVMPEAFGLGKNARTAPRCWPSSAMSRSAASVRRR
jgi:dienelactone hydrolase